MPSENKKKKEKREYSQPNCIPHNDVPIVEELFKQV